MQTQKQIRFQANDLLKDLYGSQNAHLKRLESIAGVEVNVRGNVATVSGLEGPVEKASQVLEELYTLLSKGHMIGLADIDQAFTAVSKGGQEAVRDLYGETIALNGTLKSISPKSVAQKDYVKAIRTHDIVFGIGPAGTGKTYLAIAMAVEAFNNKDIKRIILTRPAVEAGEKLGFLPGDLAQKVDPYLRPLYDALNEMMGGERVARLFERNEIEVAPLAFMRGRTLNDAFIILDEAQNTTSEQMKMFLTRVGFNTKAVITGDVTQIDLPIGKASGLIEAQKLLSSISGISFCSFTEVDVVRHRLVREIIKAYEKRK